MLQETYLSKYSSELELTLQVEPSLEVSWQVVREAEQNITRILVRNGMDPREYGLQNHPRNQSDRYFYDAMLSVATISLAGAGPLLDANPIILFVAGMVAIPIMIYTTEKYVRFVNS